MTSIRVKWVIYGMGSLLRNLTFANDILSKKEIPLTHDTSDTLPPPRGGGNWSKQGWVGLQWISLEVVSRGFETLLVHSAFEKLNVRKNEPSFLTKNIFFRFRTSSLLRPVFDVGADVLKFGEDFGEKSRLRVDPQHRLGQLVDDVDAPIPELLLVRLDQERLQRVADLVAHVTESVTTNDSYFWAIDCNVNARVMGGKTTSAHFTCTSI